MTRNRSEHVSLPRSRRQHYQHNSPPCGPDFSRPYRSLFVSSGLFRGALVRAGAVSVRLGTCRFGVGFGSD
jgi:hypothetical protein